MASKGKKMRMSWEVPASTMSHQTFNPIRNIVDTMQLTPHPDKEMIALSIGDPTVFNNLPIPEYINKCVVDKIQGQKHNGYNPSIGYEESREAVARYSSTPNRKLTAKDVILTGGCSMALDHCICVLANPGQNILVPQPGFSIYKTLAESHGIKVKHYKLRPEKNWEVDLDHLESLIDDKTATILVNNPSNPCGSVFNRSHLMSILELAKTHKVPIIADEIYEHFVFSGNQYHSLGSLSNDVPILSCSGLTKRFLVPGWRLGWIVIHDCNDALKEVRQGLIRLSQRLLGPNSIVQAALPDILSGTPQHFFDETLQYVEENARNFYNKLNKIPGLKPVEPQGAMYLMIGIDIDHFPGIKDDVDFTEKLVKEQSVFCLPAKCFQFPNFFRIVLTIPKAKVSVACERIEEFCREHYSPEKVSTGKLMNGSESH
ncbi:tyrosine aminotransferase-like [Ostrea edulis]|uniref:tyrosine aminotransferase-like n=1 Tax=Ostrea edulis TaxID=37623 RepID=UPI0024AF8EB1|nr:tyrosine aminotransferase-like [Ostrea edulis]